MFGYVIPDKPRLMMKDFVLYRSLYCGICVATGKSYGQFARLTTNYDITFLSALLHNYLGVDPVVLDQRCALHRIRKRPIAQPDEVTNAICNANIMLVYYNLTDDILDEGGFKKSFARRRIRRAYKKVARAQPELEKVVSSCYEKLRGLEKSGCNSLDRLADTFSTMMQGIAKIIVKDKVNEDILTLSYNLGKWIYLIDAVDDLEKDFKRGQFNPYIAAFGGYETRERFLETNRDAIEFSLDSTLSAIQSSYAKLRFPFNADLTDNIVYRGLPERTRGVLSGEMAGKTPKI